MSRFGNFGAALYRGEMSYNFVGRRKLLYSISAGLLLISAVGLFGRGLNLGIEFRGGAEFQVKSASGTVEQARAVAQEAGIDTTIVTKLNDNRLRVQTPELSEQQRNDVINKLAAKFSVPANEVQVQLIGPSWGEDITRKAITALWAFLALVSVFLAIVFEWRMAIAALVALFHDVVITVGVYALTGFEVTPSTVIGVLTILGYSLYDTVVVFDKVNENTRKIERQNRFSYSYAANLALNQTLVRSINTSIVALLPVAAILGIGAGILGAGTLRDLSLALFVGMLIGTYSSIAIATPVLAQLKERQPEMKALAKRVTNKAHHVDSQREAAAPTPARVVVTETGPRNQPRRKPRSKR